MVFSEKKLTYMAQTFTSLIESTAWKTKKLAFMKIEDLPSKNKSISIYVISYFNFPRSVVSFAT